MSRGRSSPGAASSSHRSILARDRDAGRTVQSVLHDRMGLSHAVAKGVVAAGGVRLNGRAVARPDERVAEGDRLEVDIDPSRAYRKITPLRGGPGWRLVHEDEGLVVVDKAAGLLTVPVPSRRGESLSEILAQSYRRRGFRSPAVHAVHRLDRFTSGLVVFARNSRARQALREQFASRRPERVYLAVAEGRVSPPSGRLVDRLFEHPTSHRVRVARRGEPGLEATCRYRVLERYADATLLEVRLETGRRNQIRVQLAARGHTLVGDVRYGKPSDLIDRTALHAARLGFDHPADGRRLVFESAPPADFDRLQRLLKKD